MLLFLLLLILGIYHITRPTVRLKETVFTFNYTDEIPCDSSYYFTEQDANQNVKFEKALFDIKKPKAKVKVTFLEKDYEIAITLNDPMKPEIIFLQDTYNLQEQKSFDDIVKVKDFSKVEVTYSLEEAKLKPNTTETLTVTAIDAFGNKATVKQKIHIVNQKMISKSFGDVTKPLSDQINQYLSDHRMNSSQVAIAYQNLETKETYYLNENNWMVAGSTYKLPLNMLFEDAINQGIYQSDSNLLYCSDCYEDIKGTTDHAYGVGSYVPLDTLMRNSIVDSCNTASHILFETLGGWESYREKAKQYSPDTSYSVDYAVSNDVSAMYLMNMLKVLYTHQEDYEIVLDYMKMAEPDAYLKQYVHYPIAQKYGEYGEAQNVAGIVYTPTPYAVVILTNNAPNGRSTVGELSALIANYHVYQETH